MSASYDSLPISNTIPSGTNVPHRPSGSYSHFYDRPIASSSNPRANSSPDSRRSSYSGYYKSANYDTYRGSEHSAHGDYRHPGGYDRYRDPPDNGRDNTKSSPYSSRDYYNNKHTSSPLSPPTSVNHDRDNPRGRRDSVMMATRMFEPNSSWKQANNRDESDSYTAAPPNYESNGTRRRDSRGSDTFKPSWSSHPQPSYYRPALPRDQRPSDSRDRHDSYRPAYKDDDRGRERELKSDYRTSDHYSPYANSNYDGPNRNGRRSSPPRDRVLSLSPRRARSPTRSRSPYAPRSHSRSFSRSRSSTRSASRSSSERSRLPQRSSGNDRSTYNGRGSSPSRSRDRRERDHGGYGSYHPSRRSPALQDKQNYESRRRVDSFPENASSQSRSPSRSSIASSRESSARPPPMHPENDTSKPEQPSSAEDQPNSPDKLTMTTSESAAPVSVTEPAEDVHKTSDSNSILAVPETDSSEQRLDVAQKQGESDTSSAAGHETNTTASEPSETHTSAADSEPTPTEATEIQAKLETPQVDNDIPPVDDVAQHGPAVTYNRPKAIHSPTIPDLRPEDIPKISDASTIQDALRVVVMTRLLAERQTRPELIEPVLMSNLTLSIGPFPETLPGTSPDVLMDELTSPGSKRARARMAKFNDMRNSLVEQLETRQLTLKDKVQRLTEEYLTLHEKWAVHCAALDEQAKAKGNNLFTTVGTVPTPPPPPITGRTTRRSAASLGLGDAVRSDFEMEQIIASLGYDEATDPNQLAIRNVATIPDMISVTKGKVDFVYDDNNLLVEDPVTYYAPQTGINDWTEEEKQVFLDKFAATPKQFGAISKFLPNKTTAQCVDYYYLHKKLTIDFRKVVAMKAPGRKGRRGRAGKGKGNALLTDIIQHDAEVSNKPGVMASIAAPRARGKRGGASLGGTLTPEPRRLSGRKPPSVILDSAPTTATPTPEPEFRPRRRRAVISSNRSSLGAQNDIDDDLDDLDDRPTKRAKRTRKVKSAAVVDDDGIDSSSTPPPASVDLEQMDSVSRKPSCTPDQWSDEDKARG
ncbi:DNA-binding protein snt1, variant 2 [Stygiomarasmius scandens]|uniref:DNA-binding protein snt1, variant 2 n=1 Tax=Marasmiellus scandens TaxID=2682957 RepID=A0ABR1JPL9_9AGAR